MHGLHLLKITDPCLGHPEHKIHSVLMPLLFFPFPVAQTLTKLPVFIPGSCSFAYISMWQGGISHRNLWDGGAPNLVAGQRQAATTDTILLLSWAQKEMLVCVNDRMTSGVQKPQKIPTLRARITGSIAPRGQLNKRVPASSANVIDLSSGATTKTQGHSFA